MTFVANNTVACEVYWLRHKSHTDILTQGYIGISSKGTAKRFIEHKSAAKAGSTLTVHRAIRKHSEDIVVETLLIGTVEYCLEVEQKLRPLPRTGWNLASGGAVTMLGYKASDETKRKISENNGSRWRVYTEEDRKEMSEKALALNFKHTPEVIEILSNKAKERASTEAGRQQILSAVEKAAFTNMGICPWNNGNASIETWLLATDAFNLYIQGTIQYRIAKSLGVSTYKLSAMINRFKNGWNPGLCPEWQAFKNSHYE